MSVTLVFSFPVDATYEQVSEAVALHFGGEPVNLSTDDLAPLRDATAVFTGSTVATVSTGATADSTPPGTVERDINGLPWDERIHSSSRSKNADGSWRGRKGVPPPTIAKVKAELMAQSNGGAVATAAVTAAAPAANQVSIQNDGADARAARLAYAQDQATIKVGPNRILSADQFEKLQAGQMTDCSPAGLAWFDSWKAAMNEAYLAYGQQAEAQSASVIGTFTPANVVQAVQSTVAASAALDPNSFAGFAAWQAGKVAPDVLNGVLGTLGITTGIAGLVAQEAMIPAVRALLAAQGIA